MKRPEEIMEILEAFDLTGSYCAAAELAGCDHHTVAHYVVLREAGRSPERMRAEKVADPFLAKIEEWVERSRGRVGADVCHRKLAAMGYGGSERTTRRGGGGGEEGVAGRSPAGVPAVAAGTGAVVAVRLGRGAEGGRQAAPVVVRVVGLVPV